MKHFIQIFSISLDKLLSLDDKIQQYSKDARDSGTCKHVMRRLFHFKSALDAACSDIVTRYGRPYSEITF